MDTDSRNVRLFVHDWVTVGSGVLMGCSVELGAALACAVVIMPAALLGGRNGVGCFAQADAEIAKKSNPPMSAPTLHNIRYAIRIPYCVSLS